MGIRIFGGLGLAALLAVFLVPALVLWRASDLPGIDDADLVPPAWSEVEPERNALTHFERAAALLPETEVADLDAALTGDPEALAVFAARQADYAPALAIVADILSAPEFAIPPLPDVDAEGPVVSGWQRIALLVAVRGLVKGRDGLDDLIVALELGQRMEGARGASYVDGMVSVAVREGVLDALTVWLGEHELDAAAAQRVAKRLDTYRTSPDAWYRIAGVEYDYLKRVGLVDLHDMHGGDFGDGEEVNAVQILVGRFYFQPNRTIQGLAERYRIAAENGGRLCDQRIPVPGEEHEELSGLEIAFTPNGGGKVLLSVASPDYGDYHTRRCALNTRIGAMQAMVALRAWQAEHGELPERLEALVPDLLTELPRDGFADEPLRWNRERGWLHAASADPDSDPQAVYSLRFPRADRS